MNDDELMMTILNELMIPLDLCNLTIVPHHHLSFGLFLIFCSITLATLPTLNQHRFSIVVVECDTNMGEYAVIPSCVCYSISKGKKEQKI